MATRVKNICPNCAALRDFKWVDRIQKIKVRGEEIIIPVRVEVCDVCGEELFDEARDQAVLERAYAEYRTLRGL